MKSPLIVLCLFLGLASATGLRAKDDKSSAPADPIPSQSSQIHTLPGSYVSLVRQGNDLYFFSEQVASGKPNAADKICPGINAYAASGNGLTKAKFLKTVASISLINDLFSSPGTLDPQRLLTRLGVVFSEKDQKYYALAYVSRGYPPTDMKSSPAMFQSDTADLMGKWSYFGKIMPDGKPIPGLCSGGNLLLNENHGATVNHQAPLQNKFAHYIDMGPLALTYSNDGVEWFFYKDERGFPANLRPTAYQGDAQWIFPTVVRTKNDGFFMFITVGWPPQGHRLFHSTDGLTWKVVGSGKVEKDVGGLPEAKNISLAYDEPTDTIYLLITRTGSDHYKNIVAVKPKDWAAAVAAD